MNLHRCEEFSGCWLVLVDGGSETLLGWLAKCDLSEWSGLLINLQLLAQQSDLLENIESYDPLCVVVPGPEKNLCFTGSGDKALIFCLEDNKLIVLGLEVLEGGYLSSFAVRRFTALAQRAIGTLQTGLASEDL